MWCTSKDCTVMSAEDYKPRKYVRKGSFVKIYKIFFLAYFKINKMRITKEFNKQLGLILGRPVPFLVRASKMYLDLILLLNQRRENLIFFK